MLTAKYRLRHSADFQATVRHGVRAGRPMVVVHVLPAGRSGGSSTSPVSVGLVVGRTVGGAVARNTVRRRLRHLLADRIDRFPTGSRVVVRALPAATDATSAALAYDLDLALDRALARAGTPR